LRLQIILSVIVLAMTGCSAGQRSYSYGLNDKTLPFDLPNSLDGSFATPANSKKSKKIAAASPRSRRDSTASGSYKKAKKGALSDRNYSKTRLDADHAASLINTYRSTHGLKPIRLNVLLTKAAKQHSSDLARWDRISHFGSDGSNPWDRVKRIGYTARLAAENVGTGQLTFEEVMAGWKKSDGHNKNLLLRDAEHMGIALVFSPDTEFRTFWTLVIGAPKQKRS